MAAVSEASPEVSVDVAPAAEVPQRAFDDIEEAVGVGAESVRTHLQRLAARERGDAGWQVVGRTASSCRR